MKSPWIPRALRVRPRPRPLGSAWSAPPEVRSIDQSVLSQGPACQLRQARPDAVAGADQHRRRRRRRTGRSRYWDENLLQGPPPWEPFPQVVGITVHLTFADRAYELARWYRSRGAKVVLGGLHVLSCPEEAAPHADALAIGEGVQLWPEILRDVEAGTLEAGLPRAATAGPTARTRRRAATCCRDAAS